MGWPNRSRWKLFRDFQALSWLASRYCSHACRYRAAHRSLRSFNAFLNAPIDFKFFVSLSSLFHFSTILSAKECFLISNLAGFILMFIGSADNLVLASSLSLTHMNSASGVTYSMPCMILKTWRILWRSLLVWRLSSPTSLHRSLYSLFFRPDTMPSAFSCTFSIMLMSEDSHGDQACEANSRCGLTYCLYRRRNTFRSL